MTLLARRTVFLGAIAATSAVSAQVSQGCISELSGQECGPRLNTITTAVPFLLIGPDSRSGGMGDAGVALPADANALHWNPSKIAFAENDMEFRVSVSPWLRNLVPDMSLAYISGYKKLDKNSALGGSLRYFNLGSITFTDINGQVLRDFKPAEFAFDVSYAQKFSERTSGGITLRYVNSNLTGGLNVSGANTKAGQAIAADLSFFYTNDQMTVGNRDATFSFGIDVSNIGNKMSYSETSRTDFLPINLRLGPAFTVDLDPYNSITFNADVNKLLVPTPPVYKIEESANGNPQYVMEDGNYVVFSGEDPDRGVASGIFGSFSDAPGNVYVDEAGVQHVESGSQMREELREFYYGGGLEYWYAKQFAFRTGYFWEAATKGDRKYFTMGLGVKYSMFSLDFSYLIANTTRSPLANTLRFTLGFNFDGKNRKPTESGQ
ncbi:MAG: type IX secretion system outer membrane channel protein PorV [Flavobacteriales bacterium]|nr:type IX secretion system outer membrane channel protein PorV [Flavobacteriales bacterium]MBP9079977.1 type IX secretion system outer membrane channel protein PorV [Flavobacteriales bacterium]